MMVYAERNVEESDIGQSDRGSILCSQINPVKVQLTLEI